MRLELARRVYGAVDGTDDDAEVRGLSVFADPGPFADEPGRWWSRYGWPWWWTGLNGASEVSWTIELAPGGSRTVSWVWHCFWR